MASHKPFSKHDLKHEESPPPSPHPLKTIMPTSSIQAETDGLFDVHHPIDDFTVMTAAVYQLFKAASSDAQKIAIAREYFRPFKIY